MVIKEAEKIDLQIRARQCLDRIVVEPSASAESVVSVLMEEDAESPSKVPRLMAKYKRYRQRQSASGTPNLTATSEFNQYLKLVDEMVDLPNSALDFWVNHGSKLPKLRQLALYVLSVLATSAPVERVFSHSGIIMRPHRSCLTQDRLSQLVFLKCNQHFIYH